MAAVLRKVVKLQCESSKEEWKLFFTLKLGSEASSGNQIRVSPEKAWYKQCDRKPDFLNLSKDVSSPALYSMIATSHL